MKIHARPTAVIITVLSVLMLVLTVGIIAHADPQTDTDMVTVRIHYYYYDENRPDHKGERPYAAFVAHMPKDSETMVQRCPTVPGFTAQDSQGQSVVNVTVTFDQSYETDIFYVPSNVNYSIRLLFQNQEGTDYTLGAVIREEGATGSIPKEFDTSYTFPADDEEISLRGKTLGNAFYGYTLMYHQPDVIAADGSTEFECYYDRNYYHVDFVLGEGGQGTAPIYAPYEYPLSAATPTRAGFVFAGWAEENSDPDHVYTVADVISLPDVITRDSTYVAVWEQPDPIPYHIVYRHADLPDGSGVTKYSYWGKRTLTVSASESLQLSLTDVMDIYQNKYDELDEPNESTGKYELYDFPYFAFDEALTREKNGDVITVRGDGSTVITLYYSRRNYELKFVYAREILDGSGDIEITNSTANGLDPGTSGRTYNVWWGVKVRSLPTVTLPSSAYFSPDVSLTQKNEIKTFHGKDYRYYYISLTAPYDADIESAWPAHAFSTSCYRVDDNGEYRFGSWGTEAGSIYREKYRNTDHSNIVGPYPTMASELTRKNKASEPIAQTLYAWWGDMSGTNAGSYASISEHRLKIYLENADDDNNTLFDPADGRYHFQCAHNTNTTLYPFVYRGFIVWPSEDAGVSSRAHRDEEGHYYTAFHYQRRRSTLIFENYNSRYKTVNGVKYGASLASYENEIPPCPSVLNSRYYTFQGWYTSNLFLPEEKVQWDSFTMPDHDEILYAYWKPENCTVRYYNDESAYRNQAPFLHTHVSAYGTLIDAQEYHTAYGLLEAPDYVLSDGHTEKAVAVGWYCCDENGALHAFDPCTMAVTGDIDLFMKWSTTIPAYYKVHYYIDGTTQKVAGDTNGFSFVGLTKTFQAKTQKQLEPSYRTGYFPTYQSTSLLFRSDAARNEAVFYYVHLNHVPYRVRYIERKEDGTEGQVLHPDKVVRDNPLSVVTEKHIPIENYVPVNYYLSRTIVAPTGAVDADGVSAENVLTFYYRRDDRHLPYHVRYLAEDSNGGWDKTLTLDGTACPLSFRTVNFIDGTGTRGQTETVAVNTYEGYELIGWEELVRYGDREEESTAYTDFTPCTGAEKPASLSLCLEDDQHGALLSKEIFLYYVKKTYPVKVSYSLASRDPSAVAGWNTVIQQRYPDLQPDTDTAVTTADGQTVYRTFYRIDGNVKFGDSYTAQAETALEQYRLSGGNEQTIVVARDTAFVKNKISFVYIHIGQVMFRYAAVIPDGRDTAIAPDDRHLLSANAECVVLGERPQIPVQAVRCPAERITLTEGISVPPYHFIGWYEDRECTRPVNRSFLSEDGRTILPAMTPNTDHTFYARYDTSYGDLTITTENCLTDDINRTQCFIFRVQGTTAELNEWVDLSVVIQGNGSQLITHLPIGQYTVTQTDWSWRYTSDHEHNCTAVLIQEDTPAQAIFRQTMTHVRWLDGNALSVMHP